MSLLERHLTVWVLLCIVAGIALDDCIAGLILLAAAPCTAMLLVWSRLTNGHPLFTLSQFALNDTIMLFAFAPNVALLLGLSKINVPWSTLITSVSLYIVIPVLIAQAWRKALLARGQAVPDPPIAHPGRAHLGTHLLATRDGDVVGCAGAQLYGDIAMWRSVAVAPGLQRQDSGTGSSGPANCSRTRLGQGLLRPCGADDDLLRLSGRPISRPAPTRLAPASPSRWPRWTARGR